MFHLEFGIQCSICIVCCSQLFFNFLPQQFHYDAQIKRMNFHYWDHWFKIPRLNVGACVNIYLRAQSENESVNVWHSNYIIWNAFYQNKRRKIAWTNTLYTSVNCDLGDTCTHILWIFCYRQGKIYYIIVVKLKRHQNVHRWYKRCSSCRYRAFVLCVSYNTLRAFNHFNKLSFGSTMYSVQQCFWQGDIRLMRIM